MRHGKPMPPLRTVSELADMLGVSQQMLAGALRRAGAPAPFVRRGERHKCLHTGARMQCLCPVVRPFDRTLYEPREVLRWWRQTHKDAPPGGA